MEKLLNYLNHFQRTILKHMLLQNAQMVGWNSADGKQMVALAHECVLAVDSEEEKQFYYSRAVEIVMETL